jgi:hypothetical protein
MRIDATGLFVRKIVPEKLLKDYLARAGNGEFVDFHGWVPFVTDFRPPEICGLLRR